MISIPSRDEVSFQMWGALLMISQRVPTGWTLIGAQMVMLHGLNNGREPIRASTDADLLIDIRLVHDGTSRFAQILLEEGFQFDGASSDGVGHRFRREAASIDVLAPEGVGERANLITVSPARTVRVPGGTQALRRSGLIEVECEGQQGVLPIPSLIGAILVKTRAIGVDDSPEAQRNDLAFLLSMIKDPISLRDEMSGNERRWLRRLSELLDRRHEMWGSLPSSEVDDAIAAFAALMG